VKHLRTVLFPTDVLHRAQTRLTPEQLRLFLALVGDAARDASTSPDGKWDLPRGTVLVSYGQLVKEYRLKVDSVRRALRRFEALSLATVRRATPIAGAKGTGCPPSLVAFEWFDEQRQEHAEHELRAEPPAAAVAEVSR
jgi:hypothetical protein